MQPWLEIMQLRKTIDDFQLGPIDLSFEPGTIHALIGKNGAGKSTLMKMLMNLAKKMRADPLIWSINTKS